MKEQISINENKVRVKDPSLSDFLSKNVTFDPNKRSRTIWFEQHNLHTHDAFTTPKYDENDKLYYEIEIKDIEKMNPGNKFNGVIACSFNYYPDEENFEPTTISKEFENYLEVLHNQFPKKYQKFKNKEIDYVGLDFYLEEIDKLIIEYNVTGKLRAKSFLGTLDYHLNDFKIGLNVGNLYNIMQDGTLQEKFNELIRIKEELDTFIEQKGKGKVEKYNFQPVLKLASVTIEGPTADDRFIKNPTQEQVRQFVANNPDKIVKGKDMNPVYLLRQRITNLN
jgi:hypothetical protein